MKRRHGLSFLGFVILGSATICFGQTVIVRNCIAEKPKTVEQKVRVSQGVLFGVVIATPDIKIERDLSQTLKPAGEIRIKLSVNPEGKISCYELLSESPVDISEEQSARLKEVLDKAFTAWKFKPYLLDGKPISLESTWLFERTKNSLKVRHL
jgi:hypothetical protein